jgi:hypothetical protein
VTAVTNPARVRVRVGWPIDLTGQDAVSDTERLMEEISSRLPKSAGRQKKPTAEELARTYPPGHRSQKPADGGT